MRIIVALAMACCVAACASTPEMRAERRSQMIASVFTDPADREGIYLAFPYMSAGISVLEVHWGANEVSQAEIEERVRRVCGAQPGRSGEISVDKDLGSATVKAPDGREVMVRKVFFKCDFPPRS